MNIEERINLLEMELAELKKLVKKEEVQTNKVWIPNKNERFWCICYNNKLGYLDGESYDAEELFDISNYFKTEEEAQKQAEYNRVMNRFRKYIEAYSEPLDWKDYTQPKYCLYCDYKKELLYHCVYVGICAFEIYASSEQILKDAIIYSAGSEEEFKRIVFGVEEC